MISIISIILFLGFYTLYNTSKRAQLYDTFKIKKWFQKNELFGKIFGLTLLLISLILLINTNGITSGILIWFIMLMTIGSLIIIIAPFRIINYKTLLICFSAIFILEIFMN